MMTPDTQARVAHWLGEIERHLSSMKRDREFLVRNFDKQQTTLEALTNIVRTAIEIGQRNDGR